MSKSKGNVVDPLGVVEQYGADALRMALIVGNSPGQDVTYDENKVRGYRNFSNKLWNIARFVTTQIDEDAAQTNAGDIALTPDDQERIAAFEKTKTEVADNIEKLRFSQAAETAYHYVWHTFADVVIEEEKKIFADATASEKQKQSARTTLAYILRGLLVMLHPFMPFVTEAIYQRLPAKNKAFLMVESWN
jgi:valyl-tRNA synthetase